MPLLGQPPNSGEEDWMPRFAKRDSRFNSDLRHYRVTVNTVELADISVKKVGLWRGSFQAIVGASPSLASRGVQCLLSIMDFASDCFPYLFGQGHHGKTRFPVSSTLALPNDHFQPFFGINARKSVLHGAFFL